MLVASSINVSTYGWVIKKNIVIRDTNEIPKRSQEMIQSGREATRKLPGRDDIKQSLKLIGTVCISSNIQTRSRISIGMTAS